MRRFFMNFVHSNFTVTDLEKSLKFFHDALNLCEDRRRDFGKFIMVYLRDEVGDFELELRWYKSGRKKIDLGENSACIVFETENYSAALEKHRGMNCVAFEKGGNYFIKDPDGHLLEIIPQDF